MTVLDERMPAWTLTLGRSLAIVYLFSMAMGTVSPEALMLIAVLFLSTEMQIHEFRGVFQTQNKTKADLIRLKEAEEHRKRAEKEKRDTVNEEIVGLLNESLKTERSAVQHLDEGLPTERLETRTDNGTFFTYKNPMF